MADVTWTDQALDDLTAICAFIARDAPRYAGLFAARVFGAPERSRPAISGPYRWRRAGARNALRGPIGRAVYNRGGARRRRVWAGRAKVTAKRVRFGIKTAQMGGRYSEMQAAWLEADRLGFDTAWGHDHLLNQNDVSAPEARL